MDASGAVKWFDPEKGFGFIQPDDGSADVFVHAAQVERSGLLDLREDQRIVFERFTNRLNGKPRATHSREVR
jgi:cold shock protein